MRVAVVVLVAGCGRFGFGPSATPSADAVVTPLDAIATDPYSATVLADSPIGYWRLDDPSGSIARDEVGQHDGTYVGTCQLGVAGALTSGDSAVRFDGSTCNVTIGDAFEFAGTPSYSIEAWAAPDIVDGEVRRIVSRSNATPGGIGYQFAFFNPTLWFEQFDGDTDVLYIATDPPSTGVFVHLVVTVDGQTQALYVDGVMVNQTDFSPVVPTDNATVTFGDLGPAPGAFFKFAGVLDEIAIYAHPLDAARVAAHYAAR